MGLGKTLQALAASIATTATRNSWLENWNSAGGQPAPKAMPRRSRHQAATRKMSDAPW